MNLKQKIRKTKKWIKQTTCNHEFDSIVVKNNATINSATFYVYCSKCKKTFLKEKIVNHFEHSLIKTVGKVGVMKDNQLLIQGEYPLAIKIENTHLRNKLYLENVRISIDIIKRKKNN